MASNIKSKKLGLALSGGGLRASYFHIGVLARMAEQGLLRHVAVISTVSGGSIIGALYYLHVKNLLENKEDEEITNQDYVTVIENIEITFKQATDKNIRMSTFADLNSNIKFLKPDYSRSDRISKLYNDFIYQNVLSGVRNPVEMRELKIFPKGAQEGFHPYRNNAGRQAKVPILVLNATSLNTGRIWQFTAQSMGEPIEQDKETGDPIYGETDSKPIRLRYARPSYDNIVERHQDFSLGHAVGASAGVPALFPPLSISDLYKDEDQDIRVQLVDGGVFDNQGIESLQYEKCTQYVISDASRQLEVQFQPYTRTTKVLWRGFDAILPDRIRTESLKRLFASENINRGEDIAFMHLRKGLEITEIPWIDATGMPAGAPSIIPATSRDYEVAPDVQERLSKIRTDLDTFSEVEAYSLMLDGYRMSNQPLENLTKAFPMKKTGPTIRPREGQWRFKAIGRWLSNPTPDYLNQLDIANRVFGKALFLIRPLLWLTVAVVLLLLVALGPYLWSALPDSIPINLIAIILAWMLLDYVATRLASSGHRFQMLHTSVQSMYRLMLVALPAVIATPFVKFYIIFIDPLFRWRGRVENLDLSRKQLWSRFWQWATSGFKETSM